MNFEEQFKNKKKIETLGGTIDVIDIQSEENGLIPVFVSSGWASTPELLKPLIESISKTDRRVVTIDFSHLDNIKYTDKYKRRADFKAQAILDVLEKLNIQKVDVIGHSEGAVNTALAIEKQPERFRHFTLVAPAGMIPNESFLNLTLRYIFSILLYPVQKIIGRNRPLYQILQNIKFLLFNPIQSIQEGYGLSKIFIGGMIKDLTEKNILVSLIYFEEDMMFPKKIVAETARVNNIPFTVIKGGHNYIYSKPDTFLKEINF